MKTAHKDAYVASIQGLFRGRDLCVVDDDALSLQLVEMMLQPTEVTLHLYDEPQELLQHLERHPTGAILSDVLMPDVDGWALLERLRLLPLHRETPVLFFSSCIRQAEERHFTSGDGRCRVVAKPLEWRRLVALIGQALQDGCFSPTDSWSGSGVSASC